MARVMLAPSLHALFHRAGRAVAGGTISRATLLDALLAQPEPWAPALAAATAPRGSWPQPDREPPGSLRMLVDGSALPLGIEAEAIFVIGTERVMLGIYEPRHLAAAFADRASVTDGALAGFGLDLRAWRRTLRAIV